MTRPTWFAFLCLGLLLVIFPLTIGKPGLPMTLKADEPAYYLMALSLAEDFDLQCEPDDLGRLFDQYPYLATFNLILMTDDGWNTVFFGKPYIYSFFAAPFAGLFGANGMVAFNMVLLLVMIGMGSVYLSRFNSSGMASLFSAGFFLLSSGFAYVFWLHPEIFNMACVMASLFLILHEFDDDSNSHRFSAISQKLFGDAMRPVWSGAVLALAVYNKPMLIALGLPSLYSLWSRRRRGSVVVWIVSLGIALAVICGVAILLTGHPSAYLGVERMGVPVFDPANLPIQPTLPSPVAESATTNSWMWLVRLPDVDWSEFATHIGYFFWGRHTGLIPYLPFALISVLLFFLNSRKSATRWVILGSTVLVALFFLLWIPFNWHGGGGFVGNRYFVNVYPAFLFLVTVVRPGWLTAVGYAMGGLFVGPLVFTPFGAPVPEPTLQAHVRNTPLRLLPLELAFRKKLPGYEGKAVSGAWFFGRKDVFESDGDAILVHGATPVELWMFTAQPIAEEVVFVLQNYAPGNKVHFDLAGTVVGLDFSNRNIDDQSERIELSLGAPTARVREGQRAVYAYRLKVRSKTGFIPNAGENASRKYPVNDFYVGVSLVFLGTKSSLETDMFKVEWGDCVFPDEVAAGSTFAVGTNLINRSGATWPATGPTRVNLSYHWLDGNGNRVNADERRTGLLRDVAPGGTMQIDQTVIALPEPGRYSLELDLVRERVNWFSQKDPGSPCRADIEVVMAADTSPDIPES